MTAWLWLSLIAAAGEWEVVHTQDIISHADEAAAYLTGEGGILSVACDDQLGHPLVWFTPTPPAFGLHEEQEAEVWIRFSGERSPATQRWISFQGAVYARPQNNFPWMLTKLQSSESVGFRVISPDGRSVYEGLFELEGGREALSEVLQYC